MANLEVHSPCRKSRNFTCWPTPSKPAPSSSKPWQKRLWTHGLAVFHGDFSRRGDHVLTGRQIWYNAPSIIGFRAASKIVCNPSRGERVILVPGDSPASSVLPSRAMAPYKKFMTTVVGAYSVPRWYEALSRLVALGQISATDFAEAQLRATHAAILEQEIAGIDVITGGEMHRRTHNRHSPPNAMLNHFWQKIPSFQGETRPKPITPHDPNVFHPAATCHGPIAQKIDLGLVDEFKVVSSFARKPVKITMTGPHLLAAVAYDEHYGDRVRMMTDLGKLLRHNFKGLAAAGCKHVQIGEPYFTVADDAEVGAAVTVINSAIEDLPDDIHVAVHICQGNYAVGPDYDGQIGHRYFDVGRYKADLICGIECDSLLIEHDMTGHYEGLLGNKQLAVGAVDVQSPNVESGEQVASRIRAFGWLPPEQTLITSSCGLNHLPRHIAFAKLRAMVEAKAILGGGTD